MPIGESGQSLFVAREVSDRVRLEEQLRQSQKLEAIGQLTGGVAHDFNNLLTVITATAELLEDRLRDQPHLLKLLEMIEKSADRGARLAHRMLAFARRQPLQPRAVDLNEIVAGMTMMLSRTLGEEVVLSNVLAPDLWPVLADGSQIEDALLNLAVNARDAMPRGGELLIETANAHFDPDDAALARDMAAGDYVALVVSDTGVGMAPDVAARAIEPFFTTKEVGEGTGLGLSMIYGFVKQSRGNLVIYSEPGFGTSIKLFLPRALEAVHEAKSAPIRANASGAGETILVVEDDVDVRTVATAMLEGLGYRVRVAADGPSALRALREHDDIELVFTDLMMPGGMSGIDLVEAAQRERPALKALMTSGYPAQMIQRRGGAPAGVGLVGKPYRKHDLASAIRRALDG
jgi:nitrogen-specific signal transduction histidine kinase